MDSLQGLDSITSLPGISWTGIEDILSEGSAADRHSTIAYCTLLISYGVFLHYLWISNTTVPHFTYKFLLLGGCLPCSHGDLSRDIEIIQLHVF